MIPLINGKSYSWGQIVVKMSNATLPFVGITAVSYDEPTEKENIYGAGRKPVARGYGNDAAEASITIHMEELIKIQRSIPSRRLADMEMFDLIVSYLHPQVDRITTDTIRNCEFTNNPKELNQNDKTFPVQCGLICSHILYDKAKFIDKIF